MLNQRVVFVFKLGVSIALVMLILSMADLKASVEALKQTTVLPVIAGLLMMAIGIAIRSYKWLLLLRVQGSQVRLLTILNVNYMSMFFNHLFLGTLGGDAFRAYTTIGFSSSAGGAASAVIMDRITGFFTALIIVFVLGTMLVFTSDVVSIQLLAVLAMVGLFGTLALLLVFSKRSLRLHTYLFQSFPQLKKFPQDLNTSLRLYSAHRRIVMLTMVLSLLYYVGQGLTVYSFVLAVHAPVSFFHVLFASVVVGLLVMIPISLNGLGVQEGSYVLLLTKIGIAGPAAIVVVVLARAAVLVYGLFGALLFVCNGPSRRNVRRLIDA